MERLFRRSVGFSAAGERQAHFIERPFFHRSVPIHIIVEVDALTAFKSRRVFAVSKNLHQNIHVSADGSLASINTVLLDLPDGLLFLGRPKCLIGTAFHGIRGVDRRRKALLKGSGFRDHPVGSRGTVGLLAYSGESFQVIWVLVMDGLM